MKTATRKLILTQKNTMYVIYENRLRICRCESQSRKIYVGYYEGSGRRTKACSAEFYIIKILEAQGYKYKTGNDAPRGGVLGDYLKVSRTAFNFIESLHKGKLNEVLKQKREIIKS
mgnify:CR=1 FL=1